MKSSGSPQVTSVSLHPGVIKSKLWQNVPSIITNFITFWFDKSIPQGAATTVWACLSPRILNEDFRGAYLSDCDAVAPSDTASDPKLR